VVVPDQHELDPAAQAAFTERLGPPAPTPFVGTMPDHPGVIRVLKEADEGDAFNFGGGWHSDFSFLPAPPSYTVLHAVDVPPYGGDTVFTSQVAALEHLPGDLAHLRAPGVRGVHTAKDAYSPPMQALHDGLKHMEIRTDERAYEATEHPLVRRHPGSGKEVLFFNIAYVRDLAGASVEPEKVPLTLLRLHQHCTDHRFTFRHRWAPGDVVIWDNRATQHLAINDYAGFRRELHRTTVLGEVPIPA
jgi:taurine dioxygenase